MGHLGRVNGFSTTADIFSKEAFPPLLAPGPIYKCPFSLSLWHANNQIRKLRHTQSLQPLLLCRSAASHQSVWDAAQACSQWHLRILLIQLEQKGNMLEQAEETKRKMQQAGLDVVLLLPLQLSLSLSSSRLAVSSRCLSLPSWPEGSNG